MARLSVGGNSKTDREGQTNQYVYDALNSGCGSPMDSTGVLKSDRLTQKSYPDSTSAEYAYDLVGKVLQVNDPTGTFGFSYHTSVPSH